MDLLNSLSLPHVLAQGFLAEARNGHLWVPLDVSDYYADALAATVRTIASDLPKLTVHVDANNGTASVWRLAEALKGYPQTTAEIGYRCKSAGLIIACACGHRVCNPHTEFLYHGSPYKNQEHEDMRRAKWFAERTGYAEAFWYDLSVAGTDYAFGAERALELGVVHEIA